MSKANIKPIIQEVEYGNIRVKLDELMKRKNISTYQLNANTHIRFQTIQTLRKNESTRIDFNVLAKICYSLNCKISDVIEYIPQNK